MIWHEKGERRSIAYHVEVLKEAVSNGCSLAFRVGGGSFLGSRLNIGAAVQAKGMWRS